MSHCNRLPQLTTPAPVAERRSHQQSYHGQHWDDPYFWLKDPQYPQVEDAAVLDYLQAENAYYQNFLAPYKDFVDQIFAEFKGRQAEEVSSVPYSRNGYEYQSHYTAGAEYPVHTRRELSAEEASVYLDVPELAAGHDYFVIGGTAISHDNRYLAYAVDTSGDERYTVRIRDLTTGAYLPDVLEDANGALLFSADNQSLIYAQLAPGRWHAKDIKAHRLGEPQSADRVLYHEADDGYFIDIDLTSDERYILISSAQGEVAEQYVLPADLSAAPTLMVSREAGFTQQIDHAHGYFYLLANDTHKNFRLARVADSDPLWRDASSWETLQAGDDDCFLLDLLTFKDFIAVSSRERGLPAMHIRDYTGNVSPIAFPETIFSASFGANSEFDQSFVRLDYESMITPVTVYDYHVADQQLITRKVQTIPSGYDREQYESQRIMVTARDGAAIPVSLVYKKGFQQDGSQPLFLYGYGAYAHTVTPSFDTQVLSALDRGFVYAIAHIRGGSMMGYQWYLDGKLDKRTNTFNDFVDVARHLVRESYVAEGNISIAGRSAGGELMGAVTIQAPELWRSVNLGVPFVDVLNTMLDDTLPLTPPEWKEWGNPLANPDDFALIQSYSPYDHIEARDYPPMFVSGGLNDPRVTYWEPAKWTAKMRATKTDDNLLVMRMNMGAGHFSNSGRYGRLRDYAEEYAFMFLAHGIAADRI